MITCCDDNMIEFIYRFPSYIYYEPIGARCMHCGKQLSDEDFNELCIELLEKANTNE